MLAYLKAIKSSQDHNDLSSKNVVTRKYVGSLLQNKSNSRNKIANVTNKTKVKDEERKDIHKGVLLRRSLAQTPPFFKKENETEAPPIILETDQ